MFELEEGTDEIATETPEPKGSGLRTDPQVPMAVQLQMRKVTDAKNTAKAEAKAAIERAEKAETAAAEVPALKASLAKLTDELDLSRAGLNDPKAIRAARGEYDDLPAEGKPATLGAFYASLKEMAATDYSKVPLALTPWIPAPVAAGDPPPKREIPPRDAGSTGKLPPSGLVVNAGAIKAATERWQRSGSEADRAALDALSDAALKKA